MIFLTNAAAIWFSSRRGFLFGFFVRFFLAMLP